MLVAIEGIDAAGKNTQAGLLRTRAEASGLSSAVLSFPRYGETRFAGFVADYLNGKYGDLGAVGPHFAGLLYAGDRMESRDAIRSFAETHDLVIFDRYVASNLAYQAAKLEPHRRDEFITWLAGIEYDIHGLPAADVTVLLDVPPATAAQLMTRKRERSYTAAVRDLHEQDLKYLSRCREVYHELAHANFRSKWMVVECTDAEGEMRPPNEISDLIWRPLAPRFLASPPPDAAPVLAPGL